MVRVDVHAGTSSHIVNAWQIPFLDALSCGWVVNNLSEQCALLNGIALHPRTVRIDVAQNPPVAVPDSRTVECPFHGVDAVTSLTHLVESVSVNVCHAQLVELSRPRRLVVAAPGFAVVPVGRNTVVPVVFP